MNIKDFKDKRMYRLSNDVSNPKPDRRITNDWRKKPIIPAGKLFFFVAKRPNVEFGWATLQPMTGYSSKDVPLHDPLLLAIAPYLDLVEDTLETVLKRHDINHADVLRFLIKANSISINFIDGFGPEIIEMVDEEFRNELAKDN